LCLHRDQSPWLCRQPLGEYIPLLQTPHIISYPLGIMDRGASNIMALEQGAKIDTLLHYRAMLLGSHGYDR